MAFNEGRNEIDLFDEIHPEVRNAICVRRTVPIVTDSEAVDIPVHEELENAPVTVFCSHSSNQAQYNDQSDEVVLTQDGAPTRCEQKILTTSSQVSVAEQGDCDAENDSSIEEDPYINMSIETETHDSNVSERNVSTNADIPLTHLDLSSQEDKFGATAGQPLAFSDDHARFTDLPQAQGQIEEFHNKSYPESAVQLYETDDHKSFGEFNHDLVRPPDPATMSNTPAKVAVDTVLAASSHEMDKRQDCHSMDNGEVPCSGRGKEQKGRLPNKKKAPTSDCNPLDDPNDHDRSRPTSFQSDKPRH